MACVTSPTAIYGSSYQMNTVRCVVPFCASHSVTFFPFLHRFVPFP